MTKKMLFAWLAGFLIFFFFGWFVYEIVLKSFYADFMAQLGDCIVKEPPVLAIIIAHLCFSLFLTLWLLKSNAKTFFEGISKSIFIVVLILVWYESWLFTIFPQMNFTIAFVDVLTNTTITIVGAGLMGFILGKMK